nr:Imd protein [Altica viridicyanea]
MSENLTTDALPNPRNNEKIEETNETIKDNQNQSNSDQNRKKSKTYFSTKKSNTRKFTPPSAPTINIVDSNHIQFGNTFHHIQLGNTFHFNYGNANSTKRDVPNIPETPAIRSLKESTVPLTKQDLLYVAGYLNEEWKDVARALGFEDGQIESFLHDNRESIKEAKYQLLLDWYQNEPKEPTIGEFCKVLWNNNQKEIVLKLAERRN